MSTGHRNETVRRCSYGRGGMMVLLLAALAVSPPAARADRKCGGIAMPDRANAFGVDLVLNGMGVRTVSFLAIRVYVAGLYLERRTRNSADVLKPSRTKLVTLAFVRDAERSRMIETIRENVERQATNNRPALLQSLRKFEKLLPEAPRKGGRLTLAYRQGKGIEVRHNNQVRGVHNDDALADVLFRTWVGEEPADSDLKEGLLGGECD